MLIYLQKKHNFLKMDLIGKGTFGKVFAIDEDVVKKVKLVDNNDDDEQVVYSSIREVAFLKKFQHPNIIKLKGANIIKNNCFIEMEHGGTSLSSWMKSTSNREKYILHIAYQVLCALAYLEKYNITHCDLKPGNILVDKNMHVRLIDFGGVAFQKSSNGISLCSTNCYQSPEQRESFVKKYKKKFEIGPYNDIFSFGLTMFSVLFNQNPSDSIDFSKKYVDVLKTYNKSLADLCELSDMNIVKVFTSCLEVDYTKRPTAYQLLQNSIFKPFRKVNKQTSTRMYNDLSFMNNVFSQEINDIINQTKKGFQRLFNMRSWNNKNVYSLYSQLFMYKLLSNEKISEIMLKNEDYKNYFPHFCLDLAIILFDDDKYSNLLDFDEIDFYFEVRREMIVKLLPIIDFDVYIDIF